MRDYAYITERESENDMLWRDYEKWFYYDRNNQNYVIPTAIGCFGLLFVKGGIVCIIFVLMYVFYKCNANNRALDNNPRIQELRMKTRMNREKFKTMNFRKY